MKRALLALMMLLAIFAVTGCGGGGDHHPPAVREILSDDTVDADIAEDTAGTLTLTQVARHNVPSVFAGIDPLTDAEFRGFLHFPLSSVPGNGVIDAATLDIFIDTGSDLPAGGVPIRIDLVSFPPPLIASDFDGLPALASMVFRVFPSDIGHHVVVDVTPLMVVAQHNQLPSFQVRLMEDVVTPRGIIEIDDTTTATAPLLTVSFF